MWKYCQAENNRLIYYLEMSIFFQLLILSIANIWIYQEFEHFSTCQHNHMGNATQVVPPKCLISISFL